MDFLFKKLCLLSLYLFFSNIYAATATPIICDQEYALCTSAPCIPMPGSKTDAICDCVVKKGYSAGYKSCEQRKPVQNKYKTTSLISTFSFAQFDVKKSMHCPTGSPWTNCVDMSCTVDPQNSQRALCKCTINDTKAFLTFGGACNTKACANGFWSGAVAEDGIVLRNALMQNKQNTVNFTPMNCSAH